MDNDLIGVMRGRAAFIRNMGGVKSAQLLEAGAAEIQRLRPRQLLRGMFSLRPVPGHRDLRAWLAGQSFACWVIVALIPIAIFGCGFAAGRLL